MAFHSSEGTPMDKWPLMTLWDPSVNLPVSLDRIQLIVINQMLVGNSHGAQVMENSTSSLDIPSLLFLWNISSLCWSFKSFEWCLEPVCVFSVVCGRQNVVEQMNSCLLQDMHPAQLIFFKLLKFGPFCFSSCTFGACLSMGFSSVELADLGYPGPTLNQTSSTWALWRELRMAQNYGFQNGQFQFPAKAKKWFFCFAKEYILRLGEAPGGFPQDTRSAIFCP